MGKGSQHIVSAHGKENSALLVSTGRSWEGSSGGSHARVCRTSEGPLHGWVLALQMEELQLQLQLEKGKSQEWETLTEELVNELEQLLNEVGTLKADRALQVGAPWNPCLQGGASRITALSWSLISDSWVTSFLTHLQLRAAILSCSRGMGTGITSQGHWPSCV